MKLLLWKQIYVSTTLLKYFVFHFLKIWIMLYKKKQILTFLCFLLSRNHGLKPQKSEFSLNLETSYLPWPSLAHTFFWFLWKPFEGTNTLCSKNHVQARAWVKAITQNLIFFQKLPCKAAHNGGGLRSGAKSKYSIVSSNMILSGKRNLSMCSSVIDPTESLEIASFSLNYSYKRSLAREMLCLAMAISWQLYHYLVYVFWFQPFLHYNETFLRYSCRFFTFFNNGE